MSTSFLVSAVLTNVAQDLGLPAFSATTNVTQSQALLWVAQGLQSLQALSRQKQGADMALILSTSLSTTADTGLVSLPANFGEMTDLLWVKNDRTVIPLGVSDKDELTPSTFDPQEWIAPPTYRLVGDAIALSPVPNQVYALQLWYTGLNTISATGDTVVGRLDWQRWLELDLSIRCCVRQKKWADVGAFSALKKDLGADMFSRARKRDQNAVHQVRDVGIDGELDGHPGRYWDS